MASNALTLLNRNAIPVPQSALAFSSVGATYTKIGFFTTPMNLVVIVSTYNATVQFSWDGVHDAFPIVPGAAIVLDFKSDNIPLPAQYGSFVKEIGTAPTSGSLYIGGFTS